MNGQVVQMETLPACDFCRLSGIDTRAQYDAKTNFGGSWANMCAEHWVQHRASDQLGLGLGQKLELKPS